MMLMVPFEKGLDTLSAVMIEIAEKAPNAHVMSTALETCWIINVSEAITVKNKDTKKSISAEKVI